MVLLDRRSFVQSLAGIVALGILDRRELRPRMAMKLSELRHPDPRPNITAEHVMTTTDLGKLAEKKGVMAAYDNARAYPEIFDGLGCGCGCTAEGMMHRSLLSCYESMQPTGCPSCREESNFVAKMAKDKKTLAEIRAAVDKEFG